MSDGDKFRKELTDYLKGKGYDVSEAFCVKNNGGKDGIVFHDKSPFSPVFYTGELLEQHARGRTVQVIAQGLVEEEETREREKKDADGNIIYGADGNPVTEPFTADICYVTLTVKPWDEIMEGRMTQEETSRYNVYLLSQGGQQVYGNPLMEDWKEKISSPFGYRIHPITKEKTLHAGVDIAVPVGTPLFSSTDGTVVTARYSDTAGNYIEVLTDSGYMVRYLHLDSTGVSAGDTVEKGMLIGATGNTGRSTGPHLHLEVRTPEGKAIDPTFIVANGEGREEEETEP